MMLDPIIAIAVFIVSAIGIGLALTAIALSKKARKLNRETAELYQKTHRLRAQANQHFLHQLKDLVNDEKVHHDRTHLHDSPPQSERTHDLRKPD